MANDQAVWSRQETQTSGIAHIQLQDFGLVVNELLDAGEGFHRYEASCPIGLERFDILIVFSAAVSKDEESAVCRFVPNHD